MNPQLGMVNQGVTTQGNPFVRNLSDADLGDSMGGVTARGGLNVQFFYAPIRVRSGEVQIRLCVAKQPKGDPKTVAVRQITEEQAVRQFPREFAMFKEYAEAPSTGTPLHELPGATQSEIGYLIAHGLRSIEDLAELSPDIVATMGFEAANAQKRAKFWLTKKTQDADVIDAARAAAETDRKIAEMERKIEALTRRNMELEALERAMERTGAKAAAGIPARPDGTMLVDSGDPPPAFTDDTDGALDGFATSGDNDLDLDGGPDPLARMER